MDCDFIARYQVKITYDNAIASGVIVKLNEFSNHFFLFTAKHTFGGTSIDIDKLKIFYKNRAIETLSYIELELDIVVFIFENSELKEINMLDIIEISKIENIFKECVFSGYPKNVDEDYCEKAKYHQAVNREEKLYRILPEQNTNSYTAKGLVNSKGYSGSGLFIKNNGKYELVGIIKEHEKDKSAFHYIALATLKKDIVDSLSVYIGESKEFLKTVPVDVNGKVLNVSVYPVTSEEYNLFCQDIGKKFSFLKGYEDKPVINVDWNDANQYCEWFGDKIGKECKLINSDDWKTISFNNYIQVEENIYEWCDDGNKNEKKLRIGSEMQEVDLHLKNVKISFRYNLIET